MTWRRQVLCLVPILTDTQAAWLGALIDGEGSIYFLKGRSYPYVSVTMTDLQIIYTLLRVVQAGTLTTRNNNGFGSKRLYAWVIAAQIDSESFVRQIQPFSFKAQKALRQWFPTEPFVEPRIQI